LVFNIFNVCGNVFGITKKKAIEIRTCGEAYG